MKERYIVEGMSCTACSSSVERVTRRLDGVTSSNVNLISKILLIEYDEEKLKSDDIINAIKKCGFSASLDIPKNRKRDIKEVKEYKDTSNIFSLKTRLIVSFSFLIPLMAISMSSLFGYSLPDFISKESSPTMFAISQLILATPVLFINIKFFVNGFRGLIHLSPNMDTLVGPGSLASYIYGIISIIFISSNDTQLIEKYVNNLYFESSAMILALITIGKTIEEKAKKKTNEAVDKLKNLVPQTVSILKDGVINTIDLDDVNVGDEVVVKEGESIPIDGIITNGFAYIDESAITGESIPKYKKEGDSVISASINTSGYIVIKAVNVKENTTLERIISLVRDAGATKAPIAKLADKISSIFVPSVIAVSIITFIIWIIISKSFEPSLSHAIQVLVISCPCALGLATPVAVTQSIGTSAKEGILIKNAEVFELLNKTEIVIFDKTGTLTYGNPKVDKIVSLKVKEDELIGYFKAIESMSSHPLSKAIMKLESNVSYNASNFKSVPGKGVSALIDDKEFCSGNKSFMNDLGIKIDEENNDLYTSIYLSRENELLGYVLIKDVPREDSKETIKLLKDRQIFVSMLSGDSFSIVNSIKDDLGIDVAYDSVLPEDKERIVEEVIDSNKVTVFVGDGINDSPALAKADVGIAMGNGKDIAIDSADVILLKENLKDIDKAIRISKKTVRIIKENLFWAFFYNIICIPLAAGVLSFINIELNPMIAALAMSLSSLFVVSNALRLRKIKENI